MEIIKKQRTIDPFFEDAINQIFLQPNKTAFVMDGSLGVGKSSNFVMQGAYSISQLVQPIKKGTRMVRETKWAAVRESENSALATIRQLLSEGIFTPEIMAMKNSPVKIKGSHPATVTIIHDLPDGTELEMLIECHGFNNAAADSRLRTHEFLGAMIFEMQGIPFNIFTVVQQRCGRFRTDDTMISKVIDGKKYTLSGLTKLAIVLCDVNIPERPHALYTEYYDKHDKSNLPYVFLTPPSPLLYKSTDDIPINKLKELSKKYPVTRFEAEEVIWFPNPKAYNMTRHFEEKDENGKNIPWTGYNYWFKMLHRTDGEIRRYILGVPDTVGGESAIYKTFKKDKRTIRKRELNYNRPIYVGYDPGGYAAVVMGQVLENHLLHYFKEFIFEPADGVSTRLIFSDFVFPYCNKYLKNFDVVMIPDPASSWLGKSIMAGQSESVVNMVMDELRIYKEANPNLKFTFKIVPCLVSNQDTSARLNSLGYFIDKGYLSIDPGCEVLIAALSGGYQRKKLKSGIISDNIDKDNPYSHPAEAAQYPAVNILHNIRKVSDAKRRSSKRRIHRVARPKR